MLIIKSNDWLDIEDSHFCDDINHVKVACNVVVLNLADIQTASMSYKMRLELWVAWPLTKEDVFNYVKDRANWRPTIHPEPTPWTISTEEINKMTFLSGYTTQVFMWRGKVVACECTLVTALYLESMELNNFPFDCQHLNFHIGIRCDCDMPLQISSQGTKFGLIPPVIVYDNVCFVLVYIESPEKYYNYMKSYFTIII